MQRADVLARILRQVTETNSNYLCYVRFRLAERGEKKQNIIKTSD